MEKFKVHCHIWNNFLAKAQNTLWSLYNKPKEIIIFQNSIVYKWRNEFFLTRKSSIKDHGQILPSPQASLFVRKRQIAAIQAQCIIGRIKPYRSASWASSSRRMTRLADLFRFLARDFRFLVYHKKVVSLSRWNSLFFFCHTQKLYILCFDAQTMWFCGLLTRI